MQIFDHLQYTHIQTYHFLGSSHDLVAENLFLLKHHGVETIGMRNSSGRMGTGVESIRIGFSYQDGDQLCGPCPAWICAKACS